jgi:branched-chain amino acid transport system ATP-binding protein
VGHPPSGEHATPTEYVLEAAGLTKTFGGFLAVDHVDLRVRRGTIHGLIGPNGAGKTTCFNLLTKFIAPTEGTIRFEHEDITDLHPSEIAERGLVRSFQISAIFPNLTVIENVRLALQRRRGRSYDFWRSEKVLSSFEDEARLLLNDVGLSNVAKRPAIGLPYGSKRALEVATTLAVNPRMLLLDEPTAGMAHDDIGQIVSLIRKVREGRTVLIVEHNLSVVQGLCDAITVMARGRVLAEGDYLSVSRNPEVVEAYLGSSDPQETPISGMTSQAVAGRIT